MEEDAAILGDRREPGQEMLQHGLAGTGRVRSLAHLRKLERVAEQDQVAC